MTTYTSLPIATIGATEKKTVAANNAIQKLMDSLNLTTVFDLTGETGPEVTNLDPLTVALSGSLKFTNASTALTIVLPITADLEADLNIPVIKTWGLANKSGQTLSFKMSGGSNVVTLLNNVRVNVRREEDSEIYPYSAGAVSENVTYRAIANTPPGTLGSDYLIYWQQFYDPVTIPAGLTGSHAISRVAATASTVLSFQKNSTQFGTATFAASGTDATMAAASATSFATGDVLEVFAPSTPDSTLEQVQVFIRGDYD